MKNSNTEIKLHNNLKTFRDLYILSLKAFIYSPINMFLGVFLIIFTLFIWLLFKSDNPFLFASAVGALIIRNGVHTFYRTLSINRNTGFTKRVNNTGINVFIKPVANIFANFTINFVLTCILLCLTLIFFEKQRILLHGVNWSIFIFGATCLWMLCVVISYSIFIYIKTTTVGTIYVNLIYIFSYNLLGCAFPYETIAKIEWLNVLLYFLPQRYMLNVMQAGWVNAKNLKFDGIDGTDTYEVDFRLGGNLAIPFTVTFGLIFLLSFILITFIIIKVKKTKTDIYGSSVVLKLSTDYINNIKNCSSIKELKQLREQHLQETKLNSIFFDMKINKLDLKRRRK